MRIAQIAPLAESVPPQLYGGTERIVSYLTEELVRLGHDVTLFASADFANLGAAGRLRADGAAARPGGASTRCRIIWSCSSRCGGGRRSSTSCTSTSICCMRRCMRAARRRRRSPRCTAASTCPTCVPFYRAFPDMPLVSISDAQRRPMPPVNWMRTVHHGLPLDLLPFSPRPRRLSRLPRPHLAGEAARTAPSRSRAAPACRSGSRPRSTGWTKTTGRR